MHQQTTWTKNSGNWLGWMGETTLMIVSFKNNSMDYHKTAVSPVLTHWRYSSLALNHQIQSHVTISSAIRIHFFIAPWTEVKKMNSSNIWVNSVFEEAGTETTTLNLSIKCYNTHQWGLQKRPTNNSDEYFKISSYVYYVDSYLDGLM